MHLEYESYFLLETLHIYSQESTKRIIYSEPTATKGYRPETLHLTSLKNEEVLQKSLKLSVSPLCTVCTHISCCTLEGGGVVEQVIWGYTCSLIVSVPKLATPQKWKEQLRHIINISYVPAYPELLAGEGKQVVRHNS